MRCWKPFASWSQSRLCRKTRMVFMPMLSAQPNSRSMVVGSKVSACHISSSLIAVDGRKLAPTGHGSLAYQALAWSSVHRSCACRVGAMADRTVTAKIQERMRNTRLHECDFGTFTDAFRNQGTILFGWREFCRLGAFGGGVLSSSLTIVCDGELGVRLGKAGIG